MAIDQATKVERVIIALLNSLYNLGQLPKDVFFKLQKSKSRIASWGFTKREPVEVMHRYACKRYMCVGLRACNAVVLGDCGRFPIWIESTKRYIKYWMKILNMFDSRSVRNVI